MIQAAIDASPRFTPEAQQRYDEYLANARAALAGCAEVSPDEIEQDIRAHVAAEFPPSGGWVRLDQLELVLARLGRPEQWVGGEERSAWRQALDWLRGRPAAVGRRVRGAAERFRDGPDDWRLAYLTFGLLIVGIIIFPLIIVLFPASYLVSRAALGLSRQRGVRLGPQRWLIYPSLLFLSLPLAAVLFLWPIPVGVEIGEDVWRGNRVEIQRTLLLPRGFCELLSYTYVIVGLLSFWGMIVGGLFWLLPRIPSFLFPPLVIQPGRWVGAWLFAGSFCAFALWFSLTARYIPIADWARERGWFQPDRTEWDRPAAASRRTGPPTTVVRGTPASQQVVRAMASQFLEALRDRRLDDLVRLSSTPFWKGGVTSVLGASDGEILKNSTELRNYLANLIDQFDRPDQVPQEIARVTDYPIYRGSITDRVRLQDFDRVFSNSGWIVSIARNQRDAGVLLVTVDGSGVKIVGIGQ